MCCHNSLIRLSVCISRGRGWAWGRALQPRAASGAGGRSKCIGGQQPHSKKRTNSGSRGSERSSIEEEEENVMQREKPAGEEGKAAGSRVFVIAAASYAEKRLFPNGCSLLWAAASLRLLDSGGRGGHLPARTKVPNPSRSRQPGLLQLPSTIQN